jgi:hypothetical protein
MNRRGWQTAASQAESEELVLESSGDDVFTRELDALLFGRAVDGVQPCDGGQALAGMRLLEACRAHLGLPSTVGHTDGARDRTSTCVEGDHASPPAGMMHGGTRVSPGR